MNKPTMTIKEVYEDLRKYGFKISQNRLSDGIVSGLYPFGSVLNVGETGKRTFQILRVDYENWKNKFVFCRNEPGVAKDDSPPADDLEWELLSTRTYTQEDKDIMWEVIIRSWTKKPESTDK